MMASRPPSSRGGAFIAAAYTATSSRIAARNSGGPSSLSMTFIIESLSDGARARGAGVQPRVRWNVRPWA
jgi:hypothetical protein